MTSWPLLAIAMRLGFGGCARPDFAAQRNARKSLTLKQGLVSNNVLMAMTNSSFLLEAANSAGLDWNLLEAERVSAGALAEVESWRREAPQATPTFAVDKGKLYDLGSDVGGKTTAMLVEWGRTGERPKFSEVTPIIGTVLVGVLGALNPVLGLVASIAWNFFSALLSDEPEDPTVQIYKKVMDNVDSVIDQKILQAELVRIKSRLVSIMGELDWLPDMLQETDDDTKQTVQFMYELTLQNDLAKLSTELLEQSAQKDREGQWHAAMWETAYQVVQLQTASLYTIGQCQQEYAGHVQTRSVELRKKFFDFFTMNRANAKAAAVKNLKDALNWEPSVKYLGHPGKWRCVESWTGECEFPEMGNLCREVGCSTTPRVYGDNEQCVATTDWCSDGHVNSIIAPDKIYPHFDKVFEEGVFDDEVQAPGRLVCSFEDTKVLIRNNDQHLQDNRNNTRMHSNSGSWEKWSITDAGDGKVFIQGNFGRYLTDDHGSAKMFRHADHPSWQKWTIRPVDTDAWPLKVYITSWRNKQLQYDRSEGKLKTSDLEDPETRWRIREPDGDAACKFVLTWSDTR